MVKSYVVGYVATALVFLGLDAIWLTQAADRLYRPLIGHILLDRFSLPPAALFYVIFIAGIMIFAVAPALATGRWTTALLYGGLFGFFAYCTYDLTNQATIRDWPVAITIADIIWGTTLTAASATMGFLIARFFAPAA